MVRYVLVVACIKNEIISSIKDIKREMSLWYGIIKFKRSQFFLEQNNIIWLEPLKIYKCKVLCLEKKRKLT